MNFAVERLTKSSNPFLPGDYKSSLTKQEFIALAIRLTTPVDSSLFMDEIIPGLYLGDQDAADDTKMLLNEGITDVITIREFGMKEELEAKRHPDLTYHRFWAHDKSKEPIDRCFPQTNVLLDNLLKQGRKPLVHCNACISRSPTIVAAFLMYRKVAKTGQEAIDIIRTKREVDPNRGFRAQLDRYECWSKFNPVLITKLSV